MVRAVFESRRNARVYAHYIGAAANSDLPGRSDMDPGRIKKDLPFVYMVDVVSEGGGTYFRFRLMGTELVQILGQEGTGRFVRDLDLGGWQDEWRKSLLLAVESRGPVVAVDGLTLPNRLSIEIEHLAMPLASDGKTIDRVFGAIDFLGYSHDEVVRMLKPVDFSKLEGIEVPKRLVITNLALPPEYGPMDI